MNVRKFSCWIYLVLLFGLIGSYFLSMPEENQMPEEDKKPYNISLSINTICLFLLIYETFAANLQDYCSMYLITLGLWFFAFAATLECLMITHRYFIYYYMITLQFIELFLGATFLIYLSWKMHQQHIQYQRIN
jgi:hypothetical protein